MSSNLSFPEECSNQTTTWVDIDMLTSAGLADWCFGYTGTWTFHVPNNHATFFCAGNNWGYFYYTKNGRLQPADHFGAGTNFTFADNERITSLTIQGWTGSYKCKS